MNLDDFLKNGFVKDEDPIFSFVKELIPAEEIELAGLDEDDVPKLLFGDNGVNNGFCIYTGEHFIWTNCQTPKEACEFAEKITSFEPV